LTTGETIGGVAPTNGPLAYLLRNRIYLGDLKHDRGNRMTPTSSLLEQGRKAETGFLALV
jgi:hypothetical protein